MSSYSYTYSDGSSKKSGSSYNSAGSEYGTNSNGVVEQVSGNYRKIACIRYVRPVPPQPPQQPPPLQISQNPMPSPPPQNFCPPAIQIPPPLPPWNCMPPPFCPFPSPVYQQQQQQPISPVVIRQPIQIASPRRSYYRDYRPCDEYRQSESHCECRCKKHDHCGGERRHHCSSRHRNRKKSSRNCEDALKTKQLMLQRYIQESVEDTRAECLHSKMKFRPYTNVQMCSKHSKPKSFPNSTHHEVSHKKISTGHKHRKSYDYDDDSADLYDDYKHNSRGPTSQHTSHPDRYQSEKISESKSRGASNTKPASRYESHPKTVTRPYKYSDESTDSYEDCPTETLDSCTTKTKPVSTHNHHSEHTAHSHVATTHNGHQSTHHGDDHISHLTSSHGPQQSTHNGHISHVTSNGPQQSTHDGHISHVTSHGPQQSAHDGHNSHLTSHNGHSSHLTSQNDHRSDSHHLTSHNSHATSHPNTTHHSQNSHNVSDMHTNKTTTQHGSSYNHPPSSSHHHGPPTSTLQPSTMSHPVSDSTYESGVYWNGLTQSSNTTKATQSRAY